MFAKDYDSQRTPKAENVPTSRGHEVPSEGVHQPSGEKTQFEKPMHDSAREPSTVEDDATSTPKVPTEHRPASEVNAPVPTEEVPNTPSRESVPQPPDPRLSQQGFRFRCLPVWEQQAILKMHKSLGHPANDRLSRALQVAGYRPEVSQAALEIRCSTCAASSPPKHARPATLKPLLDFNHKIYLDGVTWTNKAGKTFHFYHMLDAGSNYHVAIVSPSKTAEDLTHLLQMHWISWAGAPNEIVVDSATEMNSEVFGNFLQRFGIRSTTTCPEAHWQNGRIERHGSFVQSMLIKMDMESPILDYPSLQAALNQCTQAKNTLSVRHGYAPEIIVFGKHARIPGSVLNDESLPAHEMAMSEDTSMSSAEFKAMLSLRESARRAYHAADNNDVLRRALLRRACPARGQFVKGDWVMIWKNNPIQQQRWHGPLRVIVQDDNHTVWCTMGGTLYRSAPENTRKAYPEEGQPEGPELPEDTTQMEQQIQRMQNNPNLDLNDDSIPSEINNPITTDQNAHGSNNNPEEPPIIPSDVSNDDSIPQPDQEPESVTPEASQTNPLSEELEAPTHEDTELIQLTCHETACALSCHDTHDAAWRCEFEIPIERSPDRQVPTEKETWVLLATSAKKQRTEVKLTTLTPEERHEFELAKDSEVQNWIRTGTISSILRNQIPEEQVLRCRWILTWKPLDQVGDEPQSQLSKRSHKAKARLVVLGYLDPKIEEIPRDSPTLNKTSRMLALQVISSHSWKIRSFDTKAAFLQGQPQADRVIAIDPVPELRKALDLKPQEICRLNKSAYGLIDAPYLWYCSLVTELTQLGFEASPFDPCCFVLRAESQDGQPGQLEGILGIHVDDGIGGGSAVFEEKIRQLERKFPFGSHKISAFTFTGIEITQHHDYSITLNQSAYVRKIKPICIESNRKSHMEAQVTEDERLALRGLVGSLQYAAINTRPDLSSKLSFLQSAINHAKIETLMEANKVLHEAKRHHDVTITIKPIPYQDFRLLAFSDASFSSAKKPDSHAGSIIVGTHQDINKNVECPISPLTWGCRKIQKVVTSTLSAETMALSSTLDQVSWLRLYWSWIHDKRTNWKKPEETLTKIAPAITVPTKPEGSDTAITDCKSLFDLVSRTATPACSEFRVQLMARAIKEFLHEGTHLRWVPSGAQLADALTKAMESNFLRETLKYGFYRLADEQSTLKERAKTKDRLAWLKNQKQSINLEQKEQNTENRYKKDECDLHS